MKEEDGGKCYDNWSVTFMSARLLNENRMIDFLCAVSQLQLPINC